MHRWGYLRTLLQRAILPLDEVGSLLKLPVSSYDVDYEHRKKVEKAAKRWPKNTSEFQKLIPIVYVISLVFLTLLTVIQVIQAFCL